MYLILFLNISNAQVEQNYSINDPRNPNCPCHQYQKLADDEFKNLAANSDKKNSEAIVAGTEKKLSVEIEKNSVKTEFKNSKKKTHRHKIHRRRKKAHPSIRKLIDSISNAIRKEFINVSSCYHWR